MRSKAPSRQSLIVSCCAIDKLYSNGAKGRDNKKGPLAWRSIAQAELLIAAGAAATLGLFILATDVLGFYPCFFPATPSALS